MWLWILSGLVVALAWALWFILRPDLGQQDVFPIEYPLIVTGLVLAVIVAIIIYRRVRAARAARALEKAIAEQAQEQALAAKPERRAEIQELFNQLQSGINALKASKLGGGKRGAEALYALPWYVMVGPPGVGKTTALRHSGLVFPYLGSEGGGVGGVGGTRNCDWWFTNEAILLDTAGRYTTEAADHDEWVAFLEMLAKFRPEKPINGVVVSVSVDMLLDATDEQIGDMGRKIRARVDEMQSTLKMTLPVYVLFTKADLVAGFTEFFGDLKKSERAQPWGATIPLASNKAEPGTIFDGEFDLLVERLHDRGLRRMTLERSRSVKEKVYQFPLEFAAIKRNLSEFMAAAFKPDAGNAAHVPILRGFYFTSGTQEGKPLDRVVGAMGKAFGLRPVAAEEPAEAIESKSYFLRDVFMSVMFPDQDIAARTEAEVRRVRIQRLTASLIAAVFALLVLLPAFVSFLNNRKLVKETERISATAAQVRWDDTSEKAGAKVEKLNELQRQVKLLYDYKNEGVPVSLRWGMYQGDKLYQPTVDQYRATLQEGFVKPTKSRLEDKLRKATGAKYLEDYNNLKTYLLLNDSEHLEEEAAWEKARLTQLWAEALRPVSDMPEAELKQRLEPHVSFYVDLLKSKAVPGEALDPALVERTRDVLTRVGPTTRYYDQFVTTLIDQKFDENGPNTRENLKFPPITLDYLFQDRPEVLTKVRSAAKERTGKPLEVQGPYTRDGHAVVLESLKGGTKMLEREKWVVPLTDEEKKQGEKIQLALARVKQDYDAAYITQWVNFFRDIQVDVPANNREAIGEFRILSTPDWPYERLLRELAGNTAFKDNAVKAELMADGGVADTLGTRLKQFIDSKAGRNVSSVLAGRDNKPQRDPVTEKFKSMVAFGVAPEPAKVEEGQPPPPPPPPPGLGKYIAILEKLSGEMGLIEDGPINPDTAQVTQAFSDAVKDTEQLLTTMDETGQELMRPLLMNPLKQAYKAVVKHAGGAASGLWEVKVWPHYRDKIKDRYPFNTLSSRDASFEDVALFLKPKDGVLWGFYEESLKGFMTKTGHEFFPKASLETRPRPARPFTPFSTNLYTCLKRADEITDALFGGAGGDKPKVQFDINLKTVSPIVSEVIFEIDGDKRTYRNEKEFYKPFSWPGKQAGAGAKIQVRGAGGLDEELKRDGPWGIFRLFEVATVEAEKDSDEVFNVTWQMTAPPVTVTMQVKPARGNHPFPASFFRGTNCPPSIGDKFGKK